MKFINGRPSSLYKDVYIRIIDIWENLCINHNQLYDLTCQEYDVLLKGEIEILESIIELKQEVISKIRSLDTQRKKIIDELNANGHNILRLSDLLTLMNKYETAENLIYFEKYNYLLINIIENIQKQNKLNQFFLNKSLHSINEIHQHLTGKKTFQTYNSLGETNSSLIK